MAIGIWKQGHTISENGWPMIDTAELDYGPVPGTGFKLGVKKGEPNAILKALIWRLNQVEPMITTQIGCYTGSNSMSNSNHNSGTAVDYNWNKHAWHARGTWGANKSKVDKVVADFRGCVEWGGYWSTSYLDEMHFEIHFAPGHQGTIDLARELWSDGLWGVFKPGAPPTTVPTVPADLSVFLLTFGSTGALVTQLQRRMNEVFRSYKAMPLDEDGIYGPNTSAAVAEFQSRAVLDVDGDVGPLTRAALAKYGVKI